MQEEPVSGWRDEFERRCRRLLDLTDDSQPVEIETDYTYYSTMTGGRTSVVIRCGSDSREFLDMGDVIRALDEVEAAHDHQPGCDEERRP
jgi:hypothetical protein